MSYLQEFSPSFSLYVSLLRACLLCIWRPLRIVLCVRGIGKERHERRGAFLSLAERQSFAVFYLIEQTVGEDDNKLTLYVMRVCYAF